MLLTTTKQENFLSKVKKPNFTPFFSVISTHIMPANAPIGVKYAPMLEPANQTKDPLIALVNIGQAVAAEKNIDLLIKTIAEETKTALNADRCTIFMYDKENNELYSKVATGLDTKELRIPADKGLAGHVVQTGETINIKDAYNDKRFNPNVDKKTGYRTKTILCMPIKNFNQEIIGVFQVLNKFDEYFTPDDEDLLIAIASSAGISLENAQLFERQRKLLEEQKVVLDSFIETLATSIDARDKITSGHSSRVKMYSSLIAQEFGMEKNDLYILEKAAALHDEQSRHFLQAVVFSGGPVPGQGGSGRIQTYSAAC